MDFYSYSDKAIQEELGKRMRSLRLNKNITQQELADAVRLSVNSIKAVESGNTKISTVIAVLRALRALDDLDNFVKPIEISPIQLAKMKGSPRLRASGSSDVYE